MGFDEFDETIFIGISVSFGVNVGVVGSTACQKNIDWLTVTGHQR